MNAAVQLSMACFPGLRYEDASSVLPLTVAEPLFGTIGTDHVQLVPQSFGHLSEELASSLAEAFPKTQFRLHANVRVLPRHRFADLASFEANRDWFAQAARVHRALGATVYSAHSGQREDATLAELFDNVRRCEELFDCPVAIEGQYPSKNGNLLISSWEEYRAMFESGCSYALDLSHLNIVATQTGERNDGLVADMLASEKCLEIHVSDNDGAGDWHQVCKEERWWWPLLQGMSESAVLFSEGNQRRRANG